MAAWNWLWYNWCIVFSYKWTGTRSNSCGLFACDKNLTNSKAIEINMMHKWMVAEYWQVFLSQIGLGFTPALRGSMSCVLGQDRLLLRPDQTEAQINASWKLASTCVSVWPRLVCTCVDLRWLQCVHFGQNKNKLNATYSPFGHPMQVNTSSVVYFK